MTMETLSMVCLIFAAIPCTMFLWNITLYRKLPEPRTTPSEAPRLSVLIPARNEEANIRDALLSILRNSFESFEVIVMNDHSTDNTAAIVRELAEEYSNLRVIDAPSLPTGWCGKQHACYQLSQVSRGDLLLFLDADVRLSYDAIGRIVSFMDSNKAALASGVPRQLFESFADRLLIPQIHFVLLGFLPLWAMRRYRMPSMSGGCGQLFVAQKLAYQQCGGHSKIASTLHDGIKLPRVFRDAGLPTELFDATDIASCRMYASNQETIAGLGKNAHEGLGAKSTIIPMTSMLLLGQVMPVVLLLLAWFAGDPLRLPLLAALCAYLPRLVAIRRFRQPVLSALLHPASVLVLLYIQWHAFFRHRSGRPASWKGRTYIEAEPAN